MNVNHWVTIKHNGNWCELGLLITPDPLQIIISWAMERTIHNPSTAWFSLHPKKFCQCNPILSSHIPSLTTSDIDHQTIQCPAITWTHTPTHRQFDYCLPHSSQLNLSTPDSQCQFNRSGVLCGQCQHGFSTVFGRAGR